MGDRLQDRHLAQVGNFISIAPSGFATSTHDIVGSAANPRVAFVSSTVGNHGGYVPTLKLLPGSPARGAIPAGFGASTSQNGFAWSGGPPNRPPVVRDHVIRVARETSEVSFSTITLRELHTDPDGDDVSFILEHAIATSPNAWTVLHPLGEDERHYTYRPPAGFVGVMELLQFAFTDGELESNVGRVLLHVVASESDVECPPSVSGRAMLISSTPAAGGIIPVRQVELPKSARSDHNFTGPFTIEFRMHLNRPWSHQHEPLITKGDSAWRVQHGGGTEQVNFATTGLARSSLYSTREITDGSWHHVAAVYDGAYTLLYIDGELDSWIEVTGTPAVNDHLVWIGGNSQFPDRRFGGSIDEVRIWNHARFAPEIVSAQDALIALANSWTSFHLLDLRMGPYREAGAADAASALTMHDTADGQHPGQELSIERAGNRIRLAVPLLSGRRGEMSGRVLSAPTPSGPWPPVADGRISLADDHRISLEIIPDPATFYRLELLSTAE